MGATLDEVHDEGHYEVKMYRYATWGILSIGIAAILATAIQGQSAQWVTAIASYIMAIFVAFQALYTKQAVIQSRKSYTAQVLSALRPDITAAILSLKYASWIARGIALQLKSKSPTPRCVGFIENLLDAVHMCTEPAGVLDDYKVQVSSGRLVAYIPPVREALRFIERLTELEGAKNIRIKINDVQELHARIAQSPSSIDYEVLNMLADKLDEIAKEAEELLLTPVPKPFFEKCTANQHPPSC